MARWTLRLLCWFLVFAVILSQLLVHVTFLGFGFGFGDGFGEEDALVRILLAAAVAAFIFTSFR
uniref:Uncharacterized protein n=1 Tax=Oryza punctata TaxID=4537 RepID=A0A0E0KPX1_ORYPU